MAQGLLGALLALGALQVAFTLAAPRIEPLLALTVGVSRAAFFSPVEMLGLLGGGAALGALGGLLARGRPAT
jgi:cell division protein FtsX